MVVFSELKHTQPL